MPKNFVGTFHQWSPVKSRRNMKLVVLDQMYKDIVYGVKYEITGTEEEEEEDKDLIIKSRDLAKMEVGFAHLQHRIVEKDVDRIRSWVWGSPDPKQEGEFVGGLKFDIHAPYPDLSDSMYIGDLANWCLSSLYPRWTLYGGIQWLLKLPYFPGGFKTKKVCGSRSCCNPWHHIGVQDRESSNRLVAYDGMLRFNFLIDFENHTPSLRRGADWVLPYNDSAKTYELLRGPMSLDRR